MAFKTFQELATQVKRELDIEEEEFIQPDELIGYFDSAIRMVESQIIKLGLREKYLQAEDFIDVVAGTSDYDLPADIIDNKIRKIIYRDNTIIYNLKPLKGEESYEAEDVLNLYSSSEYYYYMLYKVGVDTKIRLIPRPVKNVTQGLRVIYWKDLNRYGDGTPECDVPAICYEWIMSYVRYRCYLKEGHSLLGEEKELLSTVQQAMLESLQNQIADPDIDLVDRDLSHYEESS